MFNFSVFAFVAGWVLWFLIDKHPASLGLVLPAERDTLLDNFQLAFDLMQAGFVSAAYVFIWKAHYLVLSLVAALLFSAVYQSMANVLRRRRLRQTMLPKKAKAESVVKDASSKD